MSQANSNIIHNLFGILNTASYIPKLHLKKLDYIVLDCAGDFSNGIFVNVLFKLAFMSPMAHRSAMKVSSTYITKQSLMYFLFNTTKKLIHLL